ncbi:MAG: helix-turn-helix transcriptional regulator [Bryobacteraceae bacterium]
MKNQNRSGDPATAHRRSIPADTQREWLSEVDLETLTGLSRKTFQKYRLFGKGPAFRRLGGTRVRYHRADIEAWLNSCPRGGAAIEGREAR